MDWLARLFGKHKSPSQTTAPRLFFTNTLSSTKELFIPQRPGVVTMYTCGPTVYSPIHIGNLRAYVFSDTLARTLASAGYRVKRVMNITDFGHLVSDGDDGEDKMTKGLKREKMAITIENMRVLAEKYAALFIDDLADIGVHTDELTFPRASDFISEQIALIHTLEQKGYAYRTKEGMYYDTSRFPAYGKLGRINVAAQKEGARVERNIEKRNPADFVLWKNDSALGWKSPWGMGFPGWHIECSAMSRALLGQEIDLHTGGEDLAPVHHNNEIAQSEAASGRTFVHYWLHNAFLNIHGEKISKSLKNDIYLADVVAKGFHPLALRYFFLQAHYRTPISFSWDALAGAASALDRLWKTARDLRAESKEKSAPSEVRDRFVIAMRDDLATSQALGILWDSLRSEDYSPEEKWGLVQDADAHFGLSLLNPIVDKALSEDEVPLSIRELLKKREEARKARNFKEADHLRGEIEKGGYRVDDSASGSVLIRTSL